MVYNCGKDKCIALCCRCKGYEDSYENGEFSGVGKCNVKESTTISTNSCDAFDCKRG